MASPSPTDTAPTDTAPADTAPADAAPADAGLVGATVDSRAGDAAYLASALVCALLVAIPFLAVTFVPVTDLPQQTAQARLFLDTLADGDSQYEIQWLTPNKLGYLPLLIAWLTVPELAAGRVGVLLIGLSWVVGLHALARATGRPPASAALASVFFFNHLTYWGLLNFLIGMPVFALWFVLVDRLDGERVGWRDGLKLLLATVLLYSAHVLWLAAGLTWLAVSTVLQHVARVDGPRASWKRLLTLGARRLMWTLPMLGVVLVWYPRLDRTGFDSDTVWGRSPLGRLHPEWHLNSALGGLEGRVEPLLALVIVGWLILGWVQSRSARGGDNSPAWGAGVHRGLLVAGGLMVAVSLCLPASIQHTVFFASRWQPMGVVLLVLACPRPRLRPVLRTATPYVILASLTTAAASTWIKFEERELRGLYESLAAVTPGERVLGLDFVRESEHIKGYPFYHLYAYAQVVHGNELARAFTNLGSSLVVFRDLPRTFPWTHGLDWRAVQIRKSDMDHFGHVLIFGPPDAHALFLADERLTPVTEERPWRLYRVAPDLAPAARDPAQPLPSGDRPRRLGQSPG